MRTKIIRKRYSTTFVKLITYYALILIFPLVVGLFVYIDTVNIINNQVEQVNEASLKQLKTLVDGKMSEIYQISREISMDGKVQSLIYKKTPANSEILYSMHEIRRDLVKYMISNQYIKKIGLYYSGINCLMTDAETSEGEKISETVENNFSMDYETWLGIVKSYNYKNFETVEISAEKSKTVNSMVLFQTISVPDGTKSPLATLMILIDRDEFRKVLESISTTGEDIFIRDNMSGLYLGTGNAEALNEVFESSGRDNRKNIFHTQYQRKDMIVTHIKSGFINWDYISIVPSGIYLQKVKHIKAIVMLYLAACLIVGFCLVYYLAKRSYSPLKKLIQMTIQKVGDSPPTHLNEFSFLEHSLNELLYEKEDFKNKLKNQSETIRNNLIAKIVKGGCNHNQNFISECKSHSLYFQNDYFIVINFCIEEIGPGFLENGAELNEDVIELVNFIVRNITEEMVNEKHVGYTAEVDGMLVCIVNIQKPDLADITENDINNEMIYLSMRVQDVLEHNFDIAMFTAISSIYAGAGNIPSAYTETLEIIEYKNLVGKTEKVMHHNSTKNVCENSLYSARVMDSERQFINLISKGDYKNAQLLLNDIFSYYTPKNLPSLQIAKCRIFSLVNCMLDSMGEVKSAVDVDYFEALDPVYRLLNSKNIYELKTEADYIFKSITDYFEQKNTNNITPKIAKILDYIQTHHAEVELSACVIAEQFDISTSYLSRIFNQNMNMGLVDYIHKVRLENAKILMTTDLSIKDIASRIGYNSSLALIRAFKKYEGTTPGKYREA